MNRLALLHFNIDISMTQAEKARGKEYLRGLISSYGQSLFKQQVEIEIQIHDGSAKVWISVAGALYLAIGQYGSFRSGVNQIIEDAKVLEKLVYSDLRKCGLKESDFHERNRLTVTPDEIRRLYLRMDRLEEKVLDKDAYQLELKKIKKYFLEILLDLEFKEDCFGLLDSVDKKYYPNKKDLPDFGRRNYAIKRNEEEFNGFGASIHRNRIENS